MESCDILFDTIPMNHLLIPLVACGASLLTFFSGFGLGTLLTPVFAIFFPVELAIAMTAIVHFLNGLFKLVLIGRHANLKVVLQFGLPAIAAAFGGAWILSLISDWPQLTSYQLFEHQFDIMPVKLVIACLMIGFTLFELVPQFKSLEFSRRYLVLGGLLSGFFGGISGHQGALRSAFLARSNLSKEQFIATGVVIACLIDLTRLGVYSQKFQSLNLSENTLLLVTTTLAAFAGAYLGSKLLQKITKHTIQLTVSICLILLALALGAGWI